MVELLLLSRLGSATAGADSIRAFLETLVESAAKRGELVMGEADPGRYILVSPPLAADAMKAQIDAGVALVVERLGQRWPDPHVSDFGLRELYSHAQEPWLARLGIEALVKDGKLGIVTVFCHEWVYELCTTVARDSGLEVRSPFDEYARTGRIAVAAKSAFAVDVFANLREMATGFLPVDHLIAKILVLGGIAGDEGLSARVVGVACRACGAFVPPKATICPSCRTPTQ